jgi:Uma2 family endonuclease
MAMPYTVPFEVSGPFTVDDYLRLFETGVLDGEARVELLDGLIVAMNPPGPPHASCVNRLNDRFVRAAPGRVTVAVQNAVKLDLRSMPQPDLAILPYRRDGYAVAHPGPADILLCIEVMDSSADRDRRIKVPLYARAGVRELWLVDLNGEQIEVHRDPGPRGFASVRWVSRGETLTPLLLTDVVLDADDILG